ncbi:MAG TPA: protein kinase [Candidatus Sumerlaeota bacterium]|nr:protein kinase [Candidatus Sumerlaeota bacterium]
MNKRDTLQAMSPLTEIGQFRRNIISGFTIIEQVGKGASGVVFEAMNEATGERVALKVFHLHYCKNREFVRRLIREAETLKKLRHPNIVAGYGYGTYEGYYYSIMEFVKGETLSNIQKRKGCFGEKEAAAIILAIARALEAADKLKIIHRDVKPSNIIIAENGTAKLTDFGLAREQVDISMTMAGMMLGTPLFSSPEQARGESNIDIRTDIYALGITFYTLLVGKPPYSDLNTSLLLTKKITDDIPSPARYLPSLSDEVCAIILKMCQREPFLRYLNCATLIQDLELYLAGKFEPGATRIIRPKAEAVLPPEEMKSIIESEIKNEAIRKILQEETALIRPRVLEPSDILFYEEDESRNAYMLLKGEVEILKAGRQIAVINMPGSFIGEMSTLLNARRTATIRALSRTVLLEIAEEQFQEFLRCAPEIGLSLAKHLAARLQSTTDKLKEAQGRLASIRDHYRLIRDDLEKE